MANFPQRKQLRPSHSNGGSCKKGAPSSGEKSFVAAKQPLSIS